MRSIVLLGFLFALGCAGRATSDAELGGSSSVSGSAAGHAGGAAVSSAGGAEQEAGTCAPMQCRQQFFYGVQLVVTSSAGGALTDVQATLSAPVDGAIRTIMFRCNPDTDGTLCLPSSGGPEGSYTLQVTAPGFQSLTTPATAAFTPAPPCGCQGATLQPSTVTLDPLRL